jgi:hypothetical protein
MQLLVVVSVLNWSMPIKIDAGLARQLEIIRMDLRQV